MKKFLPAVITIAALAAPASAQTQGVELGVLDCVKIGRAHV